MQDTDLVQNIRKLWLLQTLIDAGSFREAAARAKVTQSALSQTVTQLETMMKRVLVKRLRGSVEATPHCRELLDRISPVLKAIKEVSKEQEEIPPMTWLDFGAYESFATEFFPSLISRLQIQCDGIRLSMRVARSGSLTAMVRKGELCMAIVREFDDMGKVSVFPVTKDRLAFWAVPTHPIHHQGWKSLPHHNIGTLSPTIEGTPRFLRQLIEAANLKSQPMLMSDSYPSLLAAAKSGAVVTVLPERLVRSTQANLIEVPYEGTKDNLGVHTISLISRPACDPRENEFLLSELKNILREKRLNDGVSPNANTPSP